MDTQAARKKFPIKKLSPEEQAKKHAHALKMKQIAREFEAKKNALGLKAPVMKRGFLFYFIVLAVLAVLGASLIDRANNVGGKRARTRQEISARKSADAIAEALGRFRFHTGKWPDAADGLAALFRNDPGYREKYPGWNGRYLHPDTYAQETKDDPWKHPYIYEPPTNTVDAAAAVPVVLSCGPDGLRGTADDVSADPSAFQKPFRDTTWTNDWAPFEMRGIRVVPAGAK